MIKTEDIIIDYNHLNPTEELIDEERQTRFGKDNIIDLKPELEEPLKNYKPTYSQNWTAYNQAQTVEKDFLQKILDELLSLIQEPQIKRRGRPSVPLRDQIFCMCLHQYVGLSSRRSLCDLGTAQERHFLFQKIHFNTLLKFYNNEEITQLLKQLIELSAQPLSNVETHFSVDSSGFGTSQFQRWFDTKYGKTSNRRQFRKAHITSGVKTNIITAVNITHGYSNDCPELPDLIQRTTKRFDVKIVSADRAYSSRKNLESIRDFGAKPYIPFKSNAISGKNGMFWSKMLEYFTIKQKEFKKIYHLRSNVETTFSMIKKKLGMKLKTKKETSQTNEILAKCLVHNLIVLIHEYFELGINIDFSENNKCANGLNVQNIFFHKLYILVRITSS